MRSHSSRPALASPQDPHDDKGIVHDFGFHCQKNGTIVGEGFLVWRIKDTGIPFPMFK
jgi:hypothetical protein